SLVVGVGSLFAAPSGPLRVPRSFPTRRSSDLVEVEIEVGADLATVAAVRDGGDLPDPVAPEGGAPDEVLLVRGRGTGRVGCRVRSEEHTSELQSRENLVCRLLLEKKKGTALVR